MAEDQTQNVTVNPLDSDIQTQVESKLVNLTDVSFNFRTDKESGEKRPTFKAALPLLTVAGVVAAMSAGDKTTALLVDLANDSIIGRMRGLIGEKIDNDGKVVLTSELFDMNELSLFKIANLPKGERGAGISKEAWAEFVADYKKVMVSDEATAMMPDHKKRSNEVLEKHGILLAGKFNQIRSRKDIAQQMLGFLDIWAATSPNVEDHVACYDLLRAKGNTIIQGEDFNDL